MSYLLKSLSWSKAAPYRLYKEKWHSSKLETRSITMEIIEITTRQINQAYRWRSIHSSLKSSRWILKFIEPKKASEIFKKAHLWVSEKATRSCYSNIQSWFDKCKHALMPTKIQSTNSGRNPSQTWTKLKKYFYRKMMLCDAHLLKCAETWGSQILYLCNEWLIYNLF